MEQLTRKAYAKINLGLDVIRRREDGYHEVKMIMQTVGVCDYLTFQKAPAGVLKLVVDSAEIPDNEDNLIIKAAKMLLTDAKVEDGVIITLEKNIPVAAGMAGGSTDAAATFLGLCELFDLSYSVEELKKMGVKLGADIPYCIMGGTALSEGIGEVLSPLPAPPDAYVLIAKPDLMISTKYVYENLHANSLTYHPDIDAMIEAIRQHSLEDICGCMGNVLETVTEKENPVITMLKDTMKADGAVNALMSGSGPTVFGIFTEKEKAENCLEKIKQKGLAKQIFVTGFVTGNEG